MMSFILALEEIYTSCGNFTVVTVNEGELVALLGLVPEDQEWVEVVPTGRMVEDTLWGRLPLYQVILLNQPAE
nr:hypothetical protein [Anaerolineae bacterium]